MTEARLRNQTLDDIEENIFQVKCFACGCPQIKMQRLTSVVNNYLDRVKVVTNNHMGICTNANCFRYTNPRKCTNWVQVGQKEVKR